MISYHTKNIPWSQTIAMTDNPQDMTLRTICKTVSLNHSGEVERPLK